MAKEVKGTFVELDGEKFYCIKNYDCMEDFFMTITSSSDVWNFCWSHGGITAGRINSNHSIFPYYTADKISDMKNVTGSWTAVAVKTADGVKIWQPFESLLSGQNYKTKNCTSIERNIYKNLNGTKIWFEEINKDLGLSFRYGWTSSAKFGLVKMSRIENLSGKEMEISIVDGCRNILPACINSNVQNENSTLIDAYKETDLDAESGLSFYIMSSVLTDRAEPSEGLLANTSWFTCNGKILLQENTPALFYEADGDTDKIESVSATKGERGASYIAQKLSLKNNAEWFQVFDTFLTASKVAVLKNMLKDKAAAVSALKADMDATENLMTTYLSEADGIQDTAEEMTCAHHRANVMFNIMRGGFFADNGKINAPDLFDFVKTRNKEKGEELEKLLSAFKGKTSLSKDELEEVVNKSSDPQLKRLFMEYMPVIFSRRHGDPSRPWNKFNIMLNDKEGNPILNYEGNWRDIFQNWEALTMSYPAYIKNICAKFLNAMTIDGFNPYRINRQGIDWECPEPDNPWAQYGYWGDHQVIYLQKLLEQWNAINREELLSSLNEELYCSANVPYRIKSYKEVLADPRNSLAFDKELSDKLIKDSKEFGTDRKMYTDKKGQPQLVNITTKLFQIIIQKAANLIPGGGIWMNTQRPEWNDANNALAGYGLSVVTLGYLNRMLKFMIEIYSASPIEKYSLPQTVATAFSKICALYQTTDFEKTMADDTARRSFTDAEEAVFEKERNDLYKNGYGSKTTEISRQDIITCLSAIRNAVELTLRANKREDGLYHTYNTVVIGEKTMTVKYLQEMLEGQVSILSSGMLSTEESLELLQKMKTSKLYEERQNSYMLYPNKTLKTFLEKNNVSAEDAKELESVIAKTGNAFIEKDENNVYHFNAEFRNASVMQDHIAALPLARKLSTKEISALNEIYEKTFVHQNFTGRSGTFYAYEGLGSIYWHMVSKLLLAAQEIALDAYRNGNPCADKLKDEYYNIQAGLSFKKTPELYGAFPSDPYSHTPYHKGAKQPGMTGQVKEEILTRFGELGACISEGKAMFNPIILKEEEYKDGKLSFTWCGTKVNYTKNGTKKITVEFADGKTAEYEGNALPCDTTKILFARNGGIKAINVSL